MSLSHVDPIEKNILKVQEKLLNEIKDGIDRLNIVHHANFKFVIKKNGLIAQLPSYIIEGEGMSADVTTDIKIKIHKFNFLQKVNFERKNTGFLTKEKLDTLLKEYPDANVGIFSKIKRIIRSLVKEYKYQK